MSNERLTLDQHVGARLRMLRVGKGLSLDAVAEILDVSQQQISRYEYGRNRLSAAQLYRLARCFDIPIAWFFRGYVDEESELRRLQVKFPADRNWRPDSDDDRDRTLLATWHALGSERQRESVLALLEAFVFDKE